ncbi:MAG TPA: VWA domain-containing protein [Streptosporangiaceae bacterium]|nr:VWA domain-containing protein [Streptosporangiaceae bacterium]
MTDDLALTAARFGTALRAAGVPADPGRCQRFARAVTVARPTTGRALYLCALATLVSSQGQIEVLQRVFGAMFGGLTDPATGPGGEPAGAPLGTDSRAAPPPGDILAQAARAARMHPAPPRPGARPDEGQPEQPADDSASDDRPGEEPDATQRWAVIPATGGDQEPGPPDEGQVARPALASAAERLAGTDFAELSPAELLMLSGLMRKLTLSVPLRRSRRPRPTSHAGRTDLRATLRQARRTGGHPLRLARRAALMEPRRLVVLCDISGSMEPYARAMLQLLYCAAGGAQAEVFTFATRLTRLTGTLAQARPALALQQAGQAAPDWLGGTRIGESIREFNNSYGRRGMARGAVVVIISDGWDTGDPAILRQEMERLSRVAHRIVWVNPRTQSAEYRPLAGGMAAAWPYCDAVVSAHTLHALDDLTTALAHPARRRQVSPSAAPR